MSKTNSCFSFIPATLITATAGTCYGWPSPTLPYLQSPESKIPTSPDQGSWIVSIMILCSALTPVPAAYFADRFGRKTTLLLGAVPFIIGWVLVIVANSVSLLYVARMFSGLGYGIVYTVAPMYTGEIATNQVRGALSTLITLMNKVSIPLLCSSNEMPRLHCVQQNITSHYLLVKQIVLNLETLKKHEPCQSGVDKLFIALMG